MRTIRLLLLIAFLPLLSYSQTISLLTDTRDGQKYGVVKIGNYYIMAENLNYMMKGATMLNNDQSRTKYGLLYTFDSAVKACPNGWHLPTRDEWRAIIENLGGPQKAGKALKSKVDWKSPWGDSDNSKFVGNNSSGFNGLPGGGINDMGTPGGELNVSYWWSSEVDSSQKPLRMMLWYRNDSADLKPAISKNSYNYCRCIKDY